MRAFAIGVVWILVLTSAPAWAKPSCGKGGPTGETTGSAGAGSYIISVPSAYSPANAMPLLIALHGDEGKPDYIHWSFRGLQQTTNGAFILVSPRAPFGGGSWYKSTNNHRDFVDAVIQKVLSSYNVDQDRIWITGWSGGASFLGYYAVKRQDILATVTFYMGGGVGSYTYAPPAGSCKIPARIVIGTKDFLYKMASKSRDILKAQGHEVAWVVLPGVGHNFQKSTLSDTWAWISKRTLCGKTTPGSCGPGPAPAPKKDSGPAPAPAPKKDSGLPWPALPDSYAPAPDGGVPAESDGLYIQRSHEQNSPLEGGCSLGGGRGAGWLVVLVLLGGCLRRRMRNKK